MAANLEHDEFLKHLNATFMIKVNDQDAVKAELIEVSERVTTQRQDQFSVVFRTGNDVFLGQGLRTFEHERMGNFDLFIVPINRQQAGTDYEAVFNRVITNN
jgi:hypothetical protein